MKTGKLILITIIMAILLFSFGCKKSTVPEQKTFSESDLNGLSPEIKELLRQEPPKVEPSSFDLIDKALEDKKITKEESVTLTILANYQSESLPNKYKGKDKLGRSTYQAAKIWMHQNWDTLDPKTQKILEPFYVLPDDPKSYFHPDNQNRQSSIIKKLEIIPSVQAAGGSWTTMDVNIGTNRKAIIHYIDNSSQKQRALWVKEGVIKAWPMFESLLSTYPNKPVDMYIKGMGADYGEAWYKMKSGGKYAYTGIGNNFSKKVTQSTATHELFHCFQFFIPLDYDPNEERWLMEATATWSEHYVWPDYNSEWEYLKGFYDKLDKDLVKFGGNNEYSTYNWYLFLTQYTDDVSYVKDALVGAKTMDARHAATIFDDFEDTWHQFSLWNWNQEGYQRYQDLPKYPDGPKARPQSPAFLKDIYNTKEEFPTGVYMEKLASAYNMAVFKDPIEKVVFKFDKEAPIEQQRSALIKIGDDWRYENWNTIKERRFCRTRPEEKVEAVVLVFGNADTLSGKFVDYKIDTRRKCAPEWHGTTSFSWTHSESDQFAKNFLSGATNQEYTQVGKMLSYDTLVYNEDNDEFLVKNQVVSYNFKEKQSTTYANDCGPLATILENTYVGSTHAKWEIDPNNLDDSRAPTRLRASDDDAFGWDVDFGIAGIGKWINGKDSRIKKYKPCPLFGISTPLDNPAGATVTRSKTDRFRNEPNDMMAKVNLEFDRITLHDTYKIPRGSEEILVKVDVDYSYS